MPSSEEVPVVAKAWVFHEVEATWRDPQEVANEINEAFGSEVADAILGEQLWFGPRKLTRSGKVLLLVSIPGGSKHALILDGLEVRGG